MYQLQNNIIEPANLFNIILRLGLQKPAKGYFFLPWQEFMLQALRVALTPMPQMQCWSGVVLKTE